MRRFLLALMLVACDPQADSSYPGEPLITLRGQVKSTGALPPLEAAMLWQRGAPPSTGDQDLATRAPVQTGFPATFVAHLYHPPPGAARRMLAAGEPVFARASAAAVPAGIAAEQLGGGGVAGWGTPGPASSDAGTAGPPSDGGTPVAGADGGTGSTAGLPGYGIDPGHWVVWLAADVPATSLTAWWLGAPLSKGFHLLRVTAVDPKCMTQAQQDACAADLVQRGLPDPAARAFCLAPYRLSPAPSSEELVLDLGAVGLGPAGGTCP